MAGWHNTTVGVGGGTAAKTKPAAQPLAARRLPPSLGDPQAHARKRAGGSGREVIGLAHQARQGAAKVVALVWPLLPHSIVNPASVTSPFSSSFRGPALQGKG